MKFRKTLSALVISGAVLLSGCGYYLTQKNVDSVVEQNANNLILYSSRDRKLYELMQQGNFDEAQATLKQYLMDYMKEATKGVGFVLGSDKISDEAKKTINHKLENEISQIESLLK